MSSEPVRTLAGTPTATLEEVDIRGELARRPHRAPDHARENRALAILASEMAANPRDMLQRLVEIAAELCQADTAGISLLDGDVFRWEAVAGVFAGYRHGTMPRAASPCGVCIDRNATQLMHLPDRCFPALMAEPRFVEALLIPFHDRGRPVGTVWIVSHTLGKTFDREDERVVQVLSGFASSGWQLWKARTAAEQASERKDAFLAMLGHELRNPLSAIRGAVAVLQHLVEPRGNAAHAVGVLDRQSQQLVSMSNDLLDLAGIASGKVLLDSRPVDLQTVIASAVESMRGQAEQRGQTLHVDSRPLTLEGDPRRVAQIIANLLENASKYTSDGGQIWVTASATIDDHALVVIRDTGIGIPSDRLDTIFDLFTQLNDPAGQSSGGLGVGLALVRNLVELHGGRVEATSEGPGKGSQFTVRLPTVHPPRPCASPQSSGRSASE